MTVSMIYIIGMMISWFLIFFVLNALPSHYKCRDSSYAFREVLSVNMLGATILAPAWFISVPLTFLLTGFFRDGLKLLPGE